MRSNADHGPSKTALVEVMQNSGDREQLAVILLLGKVLIHLALASRRFKCSIWFCGYSEWVFEGTGHWVCNGSS